MPSRPGLRRTVSLITVGWLAAASARATTCSRLPTDVDEVLQAEVVFLGEMVSVRRTVRPSACVGAAVESILGGPWTESECMPCSMGFKVLESFKGDVDGTVWVDALGANACPTRDEMRKIVPDGRFLVFPYRTEKHDLTVNICWGLGACAVLSELIDELRARRRPT